VVDAPVLFTNSKAILRNLKGQRGLQSDPAFTKESINRVDLVMARFNVTSDNVAKVIPKWPRSLVQ
jgi:hypothetical protein